MDTDEFEKTENRTSKVVEDESNDNPDFETDEMRLDAQTQQLWDAFQTDLVRIHRKHNGKFRRANHSLLTQTTIRKYFADVKKSGGGPLTWGSLVHFRCVALGVEWISLFIDEPGPELDANIAREAFEDYPEEDVQIVQILNMQLMDEEALEKWIGTFWIDTIRVPESLERYIELVKPKSKKRLKIKISKEVDSAARAYEKHVRRAKAIYVNR